jgi:hypothetical protein
MRRGTIPFFFYYILAMLSPIIFTPTRFRFQTISATPEILDLSTECEINTPLEVEVDSNFYTVRQDSTIYRQGTKINPNSTELKTGVRHWHAQLILTNKGAAEFNYFFRRRIRNDILKMEVSRLDVFANGDNAFYDNTAETNYLSSELRGGFVTYGVKLVDIRPPKRINNLQWEYIATFVRLPDQSSITPPIIIPSRQPQSISFTSIGSHTLGDSPFTLVATASSGLPIGFTSSDSSIISITGNTATILNSGACTIYADQSGNGNYLPAVQQSQSLSIAIPFDPKISRVAFLWSGKTITPEIGSMSIGGGVSIIDSSLVLGGKAINFDGSGWATDPTNSANLAMNWTNYIGDGMKNSFTIECEVVLNSSGNTTLFDKGGLFGSYYPDWNINIGIGGVGYIVSKVGNNTSPYNDINVNVAYSFAIGQKYFLAFEYDSSASTITLFVNGAVINTTSFTAKVGESGRALFIANYNGAAGHYQGFDGELANVRITRDTRFNGAAYTPPTQPFPIQ